MKITAVLLPDVSAVAFFASNEIRDGDTYDENSGMLLNKAFPPRRFYLHVSGEKYRVWAKRLRDPQLFSKLEHTYHKIGSILAEIGRERRQLLQELKPLFDGSDLSHIDLHATLPNGGCSENTTRIERRCIRNLSRLCRSSGSFVSPRIRKSLFATTGALKRHA